MASTGPFLSELRIFSFGFAPAGWIPCEGQLLPIKSNQALFTLLETTYGGDGINTFGIPDLRAKVPMHTGATMSLGASGGQEYHKLTTDEIPGHTHQAVASSNGPDSSTPANNFWAVNSSFTPYGDEADNPPMSPEALAVVGTDTPHNNMAPYLALNICMATYGIFPSVNDKDSISDPWLGEVRMFAWRNAPVYWFPCNGQQIAITSNTALFMILGTNFGGNGTTNFNLPDIRDAAALMAGQGQGLTEYFVGENGGAVAVTLTNKEIPQHTHAANAAAQGTAGEVAGNVWANPASVRPFPDFYASSIGTSLNMNAGAIGSTGKGLPHYNLMPYTVMNFCIATYGEYPSTE
jgi:microcystin-dependent protein